MAICCRARLAMELTLQEMASRHGDLVFWTGTLPGGGKGMAVDEWAKMHGVFLRKLRDSSSLPACGMRVWERHASGGWHAHCVMPASQWPVGMICAWSRVWVACGGGRNELLPIASDDSAALASYLANELSKWRQKDFRDQPRRVRSWAAWGCCVTRSGQVRTVTVVGTLLQSWGPCLRRGSRYLIMRALVCLLSSGWVPPPGCSRFTQWRAVCALRRRRVGTLAVRVNHANPV